jgi:hypothetical protein
MQHAAPTWEGAESAIPILFQQKQADEFFTADGQVRIYEALASPEKQLAVTGPGTSTQRGCSCTT